MATTAKRVILSDVRLSYPSLFKKKAFGEGDPKFTASFLINKETDSGKKNIKVLKDAIRELMGKHYGDSIPKLGAEKYCLRDGDSDDKNDKDGYAGHMYVSASNNKRPAVYDTDKTPLNEEDGVIYAGCYVDAVLNIWIQDNKYGRRVNAGLEGVRFRRDGEAFGSAPISADVFDDLDEDSDELV
jgi:hypothetical protein